MNIKKFFLSHQNITAYIFLFVISVFMLAANPFKSETIAPMDLLVKYPGWQNTNIQLNYINGERSDILDAKLPIWLSAKKSLSEGKLPVWNHQRGGKPGLTFTNSLFTPAFVIFALTKNDALGFYLSNLINVFIGMLGMFIFLRLFLKTPASIFGAFIFMFSGFNSAWFFWAHVNTAIWTPWVLWSVYKYLTTHNKKYLSFITLTMLMLNLGGFPMIAVMTYMSVALMVLILFFTDKYIIREYTRLILHLSLYSILALMIALPFIYPLVELLAWMGGINYRHGGSGFKLEELFLFINPNFYKYPRVETTFYVGIVPLIFLLILPIFMFKKRSFIAIFSVSLFIYALVIAFTLISPEIIHKIPTLNSSLLTRFGYLIGFSLAIIAAYVLNILHQKIKHTLWASLFISSIFIFQIIDQRNIFQSFNAPVPNHAFYPKTNTINYLQEHMKPFQYILADRGFLISGTLGGYYLNDWFAHSFHTEQEKKILSSIVKNPFKTPTSAIFSFDDINLSSPYINYLNIKSILSSSFSEYTYIPLWDNQREQIPSPIFPTNTLTQTFQLHQPITINGIALLMATYGAKHASSDVELILKKSNTLVALGLAKKHMIQDNTWVTFKFSKLQRLEPGSYSISLKMRNTTDAQALSVWTNKDEALHQLRVNNTLTDVSFKMSFTQEKVMSEKYNLINLEPNIYIIENNQVTGGAYYLPTLDTKQTIDHTKIKTTLLSPDKIQLEYTGIDNGWIILPMRSYPGWKVTCNNKKVNIKKFLGMLPAIKVDGQSKIIISYNPSYNTYTYSIAILAMILLFLSIYIFREKETS